MTKMADFLNVSPTLVSQVLSGDKSFTLEQAHSLVSYLGLTGLEAEYFNYLIQLERAGTEDFKIFWRNKLNEIKQQSLNLSSQIKTDRSLTEIEKAKFYSDPIYMILRLYTSVGQNGQSVFDLAKTFQLPLARCTEYMKFLVKCGLCTENRDRYHMATQSLHLEKTSPHLRQFHTDWRLKSLERTAQLAENELVFTCPMSLSKEDFSKIRREISEFIKQIFKTVHDSPSEQIACMNIDWFLVEK